MGALGTGTGIAITIRAVDDFSKVFEKASFGVRSIEKTLKYAAVGVAVFGASMVGLGLSSLRVAGDFEQTQIAFTTMMGSATDAKKLLEELAEFAKKTPFTLTGIEQSARQLMAVGFNADEVLPVLKSVGDIAAGLGMKQEGLQRLVLNLGQVRTQGKLTGRELRDFAVAGIPLLEELGKELGKSTLEIQEMISAGEISSDVVIRTFRSMTSEGGKFENLMAKQADTVQGKFSNLQDVWELMRREIGTALLPVVSTFADTLRDDVLPAIEPLIPIIGEFLATSAKRFFDLLIKLIPSLIDFVEKLFPIADEIMDELFPALEELIPVLMDLGLKVFKLVADAIISLLPVFVKLLEDVIIPMIPKIGDLIEEFLKLVPQIIDFLVPAVIEAMEMFELWMPMIEDIIVFVSDLIGNIQDLVGWLGKIEMPGWMEKRIASFGNVTTEVNSFQKGGVVPQTGLAMLHKGETVIPADRTGGITIIIQGDLNGFNARDIANNLSDELEARIKI